MNCWKIPDWFEQEVKERDRLSDWMPSRYCKMRAINQDTVVDIVKQALMIEREADR